MKAKLRNRKNMSLFLCTMLIVAMALGTTGCKGNNAKETKESTAAAQTVQAERTVLGEGRTVFDFVVVDKEGKETPFEIHTNQETVGAALLELNLITGEEGAYGLYVKSVNGITADYDVDRTYWAFYVNGAYAVSGVDTTPIAAGETYSFKVEK